MPWSFVGTDEKSASRAGRSTKARLLSLCFGCRVANVLDGDITWAGTCWAPLGNALVSVAVSGAICSGVTAICLVVSRSLFCLVALNQSACDASASPTSRCNCFSSSSASDKFAVCKACFSAAFSCSNAASAASESSCARFALSF